jgi:hypothetical protein
MNITICSVAVVFLLSSIFMMFLKDEKLFTNFMNTLNDDQKNIYFKIIKERTMLYVGGMILGLLLGFIYLSMNKKTGLNICAFITIIFITQIVFYKVYPKSTYMLYHLDRSEQVSAWTDIYTYMKKIYMLSFFMAIVSYVLIGYSFRL